MPTLPTLTVTDAQATRMLAAWGSVANYQQWLIDSIVDFVIAKETADFDTKYMVDRNKRAADARTALINGG